MAKYEFTVNIPVYVPNEALEELKESIKDYLNKLVAECGEYIVEAQVQMKRADVDMEKEEDEEEEEV